MKLKYYLRGLGIGIIATTIVLSISFGGKQADINDIPEDEIIAKATMLGMVMKDEAEEDLKEPSGGRDLALEAVRNTETEKPLPDEKAGQASETEEVQTDGEDSEAEDTSTQEGTEEEEQERREPYPLLVKSGDLCSTVGRKLEKNGVLDDADDWCAFMTEHGYASFIKAGSYEIPYQLTYQEIADVLKKGPIRAQQ